MSQSKKALSDEYAENIKNRIKKVLDKHFGSKNAATIHWEPDADTALKERKTFVQKVTIRDTECLMRIHYKDKKLSKLTFIDDVFEPISVSKAPNSNAAGVNAPEKGQQTDGSGTGNEPAGADINGFVWYSDPEEMLNVMFGFQRMQLPEELTVDPILLSDKETLT